MAGADQTVEQGGRGRAPPGLVPAMAEATRGLGGCRAHHGAAHDQQTGPARDEAGGVVAAGAENEEG